MNNHFRVKPAVVTAITFAQLAQHGRDNGANIVNGMPWSFQYAGRAVSHEKDHHYLVNDYQPLGIARTLNVRPGDMLVTDNRGVMEVMSVTEFNAAFEPV